MGQERERPGYILVVIVLAQFAGTSLWFASNAVVHSLVQSLGLHAGIVSSLTSAVQLGFIAGTLIFALTALADRVPARLLFLLCSWAGALCTVAIPLFAEGPRSLLSLRFATGVFLAGIYPIGMKIAAAWFGKELGRALGYLVGALVLGTAFPHAVSAWIGGLDFRNVLWVVATLAALGGTGLFLLVPEGPHSKKGARFDPTIVVRMFRGGEFRGAALGYFGHMWELYAFWAFVPWVVSRCHFEDWSFSNASISFLIIAVGSVGCAVGGLRSLSVGGAQVARRALLVSGGCCLLSPLVFVVPGPVALLFLLTWGWAVVTDSPQFSSLAAAGAPTEYVGSALTLMNCLGFGISIASIQLLGWSTEQSWASWSFLLLLPGPIVGLLAMRSYQASANPRSP